MSTSYIPPDTGNPTFVQHQTDPGEVFPQHTAQIPSMKRFLLAPIPQCPLFCGTSRIMYLLLSDQTVTSIPAHEQFPMQRVHMLTYKLLRL